MKLWQPFYTQLQQLIDAAPTNITITAGQMTDTEYQSMWSEANSLDSVAAKRIGTPQNTPFTKGRAAVLKFPNRLTRDWAVKNAPRYGVDLDTDFPWLARPMGEKFKELNGPVPKTASDLLQVAMGSRFYSENPEAKYANPSQLTSGGTPGEVNPPQERTRGPIAPQHGSVWREGEEPDVQQQEYPSEITLWNGDIEPIDANVVDEIYGFAYGAWKDADIALTMTAIALAESGGDHWAEGDGGSSIGYYQINSAEKQFERELKNYDLDDRYSKKLNTDMAVDVGLLQLIEKARTSDFEYNKEYDVDLSRWSVTHTDNPATRRYLDFEEVAKVAAVRAGHSDAQGDFSGRTGWNDVRSFYGNN